MKPGAKLDTNLLRYATPLQARALRAVAEHGSQRKAAKFLGVAHQVVQRACRAVTDKASAAGYHPATDDTHEVAPGYVVRGTSKLYKAGQEEPALTWVKTRQSDEDRLALLRAALEDVTQEFRGAWGSKPRPTDTSADLLAVYPIGDLHVGMLAWGKETGVDWDLSIAAAEIRRVTSALVASMPSAENALIINVGDFFHADDSRNETPTNHHRLDVDGRFPKILTVGIALMRAIIDEALRKHETVTVWNRSGNHDPHTSVMLAVTLAAVYEHEPRVKVSREFGQFDVLQFGSCLLGSTHGHTIKGGQLPLLLAARYPELWGATKHRCWYTGHVHHDEARSFAGCSVESTRIIPPKDAWAHGAGYDAERGMHADVWHRTRGRIARRTECL
jgi:hypothetical protein